MTDLVGTISRSQQGSTGGQGTQNPRAIALNSMGMQVIMDWRSKMMLDGLGYQVKLGSISAPVTGDGTAITDQAAEMSIDGPAGTTLFPLDTWVSTHALTGDVSEVQLNTVQAIAASGTAFTPLPLRTGGPASGLVGRAAATGAVSVTADAVTTTVTLFNAHSQEGATPATDTALTDRVMRYEPLGSPVLVGACSLYLQVAIMTYFAAMNFIQIDSDLVAR